MTRLLFKILPGIAFMAQAVALASPAGFPEPPLVIYGKVLNTAGGGTGTQIYAGTTAWTVTPPAGHGAAFTVSANLKDIGSGAYSYRIEIPAEKVPATFSLSADTISASSASLSYTLSAKVNDAAAIMVLPSASPHSGIVTFQEIQRGKTERIDLNYTGDVTDSDGDGIPDWWEELYAPAADKNNPADAPSDPDADGVPNIAEYGEGTDPTCLEYAKWLTRNNLTPGSALSRPDADPDNDGLKNLMEYALGTDPRTADAQSAASRVTASVTTVAGERYLSLSVNRAPARQCNADYLVEVSDDLSVWKSTEGTDVVTFLSQASILQVRDARLIQADGSQRFMRLKINPKGL